MAERKIEPVEEIVEETVEDAPASPQTQNNHDNPSSIQEAKNSRPSSSSNPSENTSCVRNEVLDEVVAHQKQRISQLERQVDKRKETLWRLSSSSPFIPPPGLGGLPPPAPPPTIPPSSAASVSHAVPTSQTQPNQLPATSDTVNPTQQQQHQSQPLAHNPAIAATVAAMTAASTRSLSPALHPQYPFFPFTHPDNPVIAHPFMGIMSPIPSHPAPTPVQTPSTTPSQPNQVSEDGGTRQSRYWTADEHQRYLTGVSTFGPKNYQQIAEVVGTRNAKQVRTHSQKYQKKLEREEARRRGEAPPLSDVHSCAQTDTTLAAVMVDGTPRPAPNQFRQNGAHGGPASLSSKHVNLSEAPQSAKSAEGSSSANNVSSERNAESSTDTVQANAKAAAAAAVAAEAVALGFGRLPARPSTLLSRHQVARNPNVSLQAQTRRPRETRIAKANGGSVPSTPNGETSTNPGKPMQNRDKMSSPAVIRPSMRTNTSAPRPEAKLAATMPAGRGVESHQVAKQVFDQKAHNSAEATSPLLRQSHTSVNFGGAHSRVGSDKQQVPKVVQSAVKIEPRTVAQAPSNGPFPGSCPIPDASGHSRLAVLTTSVPSKLETKTANVKSSRHIAERIVQRHMVADRNAPPETEVDKNGPVVLKKAVSAMRHHKSEVIPNGRQGSQTFSPRATPIETVASHKLNADTLSRPTGSKHAAQSSSSPSAKSDASCQTSNEHEASGSGKRFDKPQPIVPTKAQVPEGHIQQTQLENGVKKSSVQEAPRTSDVMHESAEKDTLLVPKENDCSVQPRASGSASIDGVSQKELKDGRAQECEMDTSDGHIKRKSSPKRPVEQAMRTELSDSLDSCKTGCAIRCGVQTKLAPSSTMVTAASCEEAVPKSDDQPDCTLGSRGQSTESDRERLVKGAHLREQCCSTTSPTKEGHGNREAIKKLQTGSGDTGMNTGIVKVTEKEARTGSDFEIPNGHGDQGVKGDRFAQDSAASEGRDNDKSTEEESKNVMGTDRRQVLMESGKRVDVKRALESKTESVTKRRKENNSSSRIDREDEDIGTKFNGEAGKT